MIPYVTNFDEPFKKNPELCNYPGVLSQLLDNNRFTIIFWFNRWRRKIVGENS